MRKHRARKGFTLIELMVAMVVASVLLMGMALVLITLFRGMRESSNFATMTGRVDLIRQLSFDARTGNQILLPAANGPGSYTAGPNEGHQIRFNALIYDPGPETTSSVIITWESSRLIATPTEPFTVNRFVNTGGGDVFTFGQNNITEFVVNRTSVRNFNVAITTEEEGETVQVQLAVTLRNVVE